MTQHGGWASIAQFRGIDVQFYTGGIGVEHQFHDKKSSRTDADGYSAWEIAVADAQRPAAFSGYIALSIEVAELDLFTGAVVAPGQTAAVQACKYRLVVVPVFAQHGTHPERAAARLRADAFVEFAHIGAERPVVAGIEAAASGEVGFATRSEAAQGLQVAESQAASAGAGLEAGQRFVVVLCEPGLGPACAAVLVIEGGVGGVVEAIVGEVDAGLAGGQVGEQEK